MITYINFLPDGYSYMVAETSPKLKDIVLIKTTNEIGEIIQDIDEEGETWLVRNTVGTDKDGSRDFWSHELKVIIASDNKDLADKGILWLEVPVNGVDVEEIIRDIDDVLIHLEDYMHGKEGEMVTEARGYIIKLLELTKEKRFSLEQMREGIKQGWKQGYYDRALEEPDCNYKVSLIIDSLSSLTKTIECEVEMEDGVTEGAINAQLSKLLSCRKTINGIERNCITYKVKWLIRK